MNSKTIRRRFLDYFRQKGHTIAPSASVVPHDDPTLLFTNAGMNPFKDVFLGAATRDYTRAASSQKCIRVGGKHNDLDNVGHTKRHLTFFEMLGNFSFGDYFKKEAIAFAWEVSTQVFELDANRIWASVYHDDQEAYDLWTQYLPKERIARLGEKDNFWAMGDTGPCGPCSELYFDQGEQYGSKSLEDDPDGDRYFEFWNLVFMQYQRDREGNLTPLPKPCVDTGMGLERITSLKMGVDHVFATDILGGLIEEIEKAVQRPYQGEDVAAFHVIADHLRCLAFAIADGAQPSNVERGYVLRKVLRRAVRYGRQLGQKEPFLAKIFPRLLREMGEDYPELVESKIRIEEILNVEEEAFLRTLQRGGNRLQQVIEHAHETKDVISGEEAFTLKDTYGFPLEEILLLAKDAHLSVDTKRFEELEEEARHRSKKAHKKHEQLAEENLFVDFIEEYGPSAFVGYKQTSADANVRGLLVDGVWIETMMEGQEGMVLLDETPFYAEKGGQIGDTGLIHHEAVVFRVKDCISPYKNVIAHLGVLEKGNLTFGEAVTATIDEGRRQRIENNHTATHLLHWALQKVLGDHIRQAGSIVEPGRLRFDFSHHKGLTKEEIRAIEDIVNQMIRENRDVDAYELSYEEAQKKKEIKQFFGEKYDQTVRVIDLGDSKELCGGTHTSHTGNIGAFVITKEGSIASGIRRIEAVSGPEAETFFREKEDRWEALAEKLGVAPQKVNDRIDRLIEEHQQLQALGKEFAKAEQKKQVEALFGQIKSEQECSYLVAEVSAASKDLRDIATQVMDRVGSGIVILGAREDEKSQVAILVSDPWVKQGCHAGELAKLLAPLIDGGGGGKPNQAQVGGKNPAALPEALKKAEQWIHERLEAK